MSKQIGDHYEQVAKAFLQKQGLIILEQNFHSYRGEIDLICRDRDTLVFVEVRYRKKTQFANSVESVGYQKRAHLIQSARFFLQQRGWTDKYPCRFDVIAIKEDPLNPIEWIKHAFER